jgi:hypothetical protein
MIRFAKICAGSLNKKRQSIPIVDGVYNHLRAQLKHRKIIVK